DRVTCFNPERFIVDLADGSSVGQPKPTCPGFAPFQGARFRNVLILNESVVISVLVHDFKLVYLTRFFAFHSFTPLFPRFEFRLIFGAARTAMLPAWLRYILVTSEGRRPAISAPNLGLKEMFSSAHGSSGSKPVKALIKLLSGQILCVQHDLKRVNSRARNFKILCVSVCVSPPRNAKE